MKRGAVSKHNGLVTDYDYKTEERRVLAGVGCYGFDDPTPRIAEALGVNLDDYDYDDVVHGYTSWGDKGYFEFHLTKEVDGDFKVVKELRLPGKGNEHLDSRFVGVTPETREEFFKWLEGMPAYRNKYEPWFKEWVEKCRADGGTRFNQGDAFFTTNIGVDLQATSPGDAKTPTLLRALDDEEEET